MSGSMQLKQYLANNKKSPRQFAVEIGVKETTVYRWMSGDRFPRQHLQKIAKATKGKVTANDFALVAA